MKSLIVESTRYARLLAVAAFLSVGAAACTDAESREAPGEGDPPEQMTAEDETRPDEAGDPSSEEVSGTDQTAMDPTPVETTDEPAELTLAPAGTTMAFSVDQAISTDTHAVGDRFEATLDAPVRDADGNEVLAAGTASRWVVTQSSVEDGEALLAMKLESVKVDERWVPIAATVIEADLDADNPDSAGETAAKIGVGAAAGALVGQILGQDSESTLAGAGVGAAVGTAVALATRGGSASLPAGSVLSVRLDEPLVAS